VTPGELYLLSPMGQKFPHIQDLFPYMKGGKVLIIKTQTTIVKGKKKKISIETVEFLFDGKIYSESINNFRDHAIYIDKDL
jgi:hypothetical protein